MHEVVAQLASFVLRFSWLLQYQPREARVSSYITYPNNNVLLLHILYQEKVFVFYIIALPDHSDVTGQESQGKVKKKKGSQGNGCKVSKISQFGLNILIIVLWL